MVLVVEWSFRPFTDLMYTCAVYVGGVCLRYCELKLLFKMLLYHKCLIAEDDNILPGHIILTPGQPSLALNFMLGAQQSATMKPNSFEVPTFQSSRWKAYRFSVQHDF